MRSLKKELLDQDKIPKADLQRNLYELEVINRLLGGHKATIKGLKHLLVGISGNKEPITIVDIGSGGGDTLKVIAKWAQRQKFSVNLIGVDLKTDAIKYARRNCASYKNVSFIQSNYRALPDLGLRVDIYINSLFCHHLNDEEITTLLQFMAENTYIGFMINDLHRHPLAYWSIKCLTGLFSKSYLVKNDAPLSVLRGFKRKELIELAMHADVPVTIKWGWAFRWLINYKTP